MLPKEWLTSILLSFFRQFSAFFCTYLSFDQRRDRLRLATSNNEVLLRIAAADLFGNVALR